MTLSTDTSAAALAAIENARSSALVHLNKAFDELAAKFSPAPTAEGVHYKMPTADDGRDPRNKNGNNLTPRGLEILFRVFDDDGGYNRAGKLLNITQAAAKNRKQQWVQQGGKARTKSLLDIDDVI